MFEGQVLQRDCSMISIVQTGNVLDQRFATVTNTANVTGNALSVITWNKGAFEPILRDALRAHPELLVGLDSNGITQRETADALVDRFAANEAKYQPTPVGLMLDAASMTRIPNVERMKDADERAG